MIEIGPQRHPIVAGVIASAGSASGGSSSLRTIAVARGGGTASARSMSNRACSSASRSMPSIARLARASASPSRHIATSAGRSEEHTSELQSLMRNSYAVFCLKKKKNNTQQTHISEQQIKQTYQQTK